MQTQIYAYKDKHERTSARLDAAVEQMFADKHTNITSIRANTHSEGRASCVSFPNAVVSVAAFLAMHSLIDFVHFCLLLAFRFCLSVHEHMRKHLMTLLSLF